MFGSWRVRVGIAALALLSACVPVRSFFSNVPWDGGANHTLTYQTFRIGPYNLAPINEPGWEVIGNQTMPKPAGNVAIHSTDFSIVDAAGNTVGLDRVHLHHIVMMDESVPDPLCPTVGARFTGTGAERTKLELNGAYAYRSDATDVWTSTFHIHTTSTNPAPGVYLQYVIGYDPITPEHEPPLHDAVLLRCHRVLGELGVAVRRARWRRYRECAHRDQDLHHATRRYRRLRRGPYSCRRPERQPDPRTRPARPTAPRPRAMRPAGTRTIRVSVSCREFPHASCTRR